MSERPGAAAWLRSLLPAWGLGWLAAWRRRQGCYDQATLALLSVAARRSGSDVALLRLALFRRDLGRVLPGRWVPRLLRSLPGLPLRWRRRALGLLAEVDPGQLAGLDRHWLADAAAAQPGVAQALAPSPLDDADRQRLAFADWLRRRGAAGGIAVVGNAAGLAGTGLGARIDGHGAVIRFNRWHGADTVTADIGQRIDVWVVSPELDVTVPAGLSWAIVSGPDPRFLMRRWTLARRLHDAGVAVLTVPLPVWRTLVARLDAPPTAGVLTLAWLHTLLGSWQGVSVAGIGWGTAPDGRHHLVDAGSRIGRRHRWSEEGATLAAWRDEGLQDLRQTEPPVT